MKIFFACNLPIDLRPDIHKKWYDNYKLTHFQDEAEIIMVGINPIDCRHYKKAIYFVCPATNVDHITNLNSNHRIISLLGASDFLEDVWSTAEHTMTLICMMARNVFEKPNFWSRFDFVGTTLRGKTLGIIGYGRVGKQLEKIAHDGFGMTVMPYDLDKTTPWRKAEVLMAADFLSINVSVTPNSPPAITRSDLALIRKGTFIVNTSRGKAIDENFIIENAAYFGGIALDVLDGEPNPPNFQKLHKLPNVILTPHISGCTMDDMKKTSDYCYQLLQGIKQHDKAIESQYHC